MGGLALRRARSTWTAAARSTATRPSGRTSSTRPRRTSLAAADSRPWPRRSATRSRASPPSCSLPPGDSLAAPLRDRPLTWEADAARLGPLPRRHVEVAPLPSRRRARVARGKSVLIGARRDVDVISMFLRRSAASRRRRACPTHRPPAADRRYEAESPEDFFSVAAFSAGLSVVFSEEEGSPSPCATFRARSRSVKPEPLKCTATGKRASPSAPRRRQGTPPAAGPSSSGRARRCRRSGTGTRRSARWERLARALVGFALVLQQLEVAGRALEGGEAARRPRRDAGAPAPVDGGDRGRGRRARRGRRRRPPRRWSPSML